MSIQDASKEFIEREYIEGMLKELDIRVGDRVGQGYFRSILAMAYEAGWVDGQVEVAKETLSHIKTLKESL